MAILMEFYSMLLACWVHARFMLNITDEYGRGIDPHLPWLRASDGLTCSVACRDTDFEQKKKLLG